MILLSSFKKLWVVFGEGNGVVTEFGKDLLYKIKDMGVAICNDLATQKYLASQSIKASIYVV